MSNCLEGSVCLREREIQVVKVDHNGVKKLRGQDKTYGNDVRV